MTQEQRALLAGVLSLVVFLGWYQFFGKNLTPPSVSPPPPVVSSPAQEESVEDKATAAETPVNGFESNQVRWESSSRGGRLSSVFLKNYQINLILSGQDKALSLICSDCNFTLPAEDSYRLKSSREGEVIYEANAGGVRVRRVYRYSAQEGYPLGLEIGIENHTSREISGEIGVTWKGAQKQQQTSSGFASFAKRPADLRSFVYQVGGKIEHAGQHEEVKEISGPVAWAGIEDRYFLMAIISRRLSSEGSLRMIRDLRSVSLAYTPGTISVAPGGVHLENYTVYLGPKDREVLKGLGVGLEGAIDYGVLSFFAIPILQLLLFFHTYLRNWGIAIIVLTIVVKLLLNPLSIKALRQMKEMQKLQPKLTELKEKYKNDRQRLNLETMQLFKNHKVNPMGGCLPMVVQMPIYIALYKVLYNSIELYHAPFFGFYRDLSGPDPYFILPILLGIFMVLQQKMSPTPSADPAQKQMMMLMPIMFTVFMLFLPIGLVLYILVNTLMTVSQQYLFQRGIKLRNFIGLASRG